MEESDKKSLITEDDDHFWHSKRFRVFICMGAVMSLLVGSILIVLFVVVLNKNPDSDSSSKLIVYTTYGDVSGFNFRSKSGIQLMGWRGVPFAKSPSGSLRWMPPVAPDSWATPLNCSSFKTECVQPSGTGSEDCLYLNVYTGPETTGLAPVLFYIYGGGLMSGSTSDDDFSIFLANSFNASDDGVVVVQVAYRLNLFGFLATADLSQEQNETSGNYGLQDMIFALEWTKNNIENFGGDPACVTIAGQSSGGTSVMGLLVSPLAKGLFHRAISLSGSQNISMPLLKAQVQNEPIVNSTGCLDLASSTNTLNCMRALNVSQVVAVIPNAWNMPGIFGPPAGPGGMGYEGILIVDGKIIPLSYNEALKKGTPTCNDVPFIVGNMGQESDMYPDNFVANYTSQDWKNFLVQWYTPYDHINTTYSDSGDYNSTGEVIYSLYEKESNESPQKAYDAIVSDYGNGCPSIEIARNALPPQGNFQSNMYVFSNQWNLSKPFLDTNDPWPSASNNQYNVCWAWHTLDLYIMNEQWSAYGDGSYVPSDVDLDGSRTIQGYWYQFMKSGSPIIGDDDSSWPAINKLPEGYSWPGNYSLFEISPLENGPHTIVNYGSTVCSYNDQLGISSRGFWWAN